MIALRTESLWIGTPGVEGLGVSGATAFDLGACSGVPCFLEILNNFQQTGD